MEKDKNIKPALVQTYAEDMAKVIEDDKGGLIKKIIHGEEEHEIERRNMSPGSKKNKFFLFASIVFAVLALAILGFFFFKKEISTVPVEQQLTPVVFSDKSYFIEVAGLKKDEIIQTILNERDTTALKNKGVERIYLTFNKKVAGLREFITLLKSNLVLGGVNLVDDNFLFGVVAGETSKDFFILIKVRSLADIFNSLRAWESKMLPDLHGFFGVDLTSETNYLFTKNFEDGIVENRNARILYDKDQKIVMMYVFADDNSVIVTNSVEATREIMLRLASSQIKK